MDYDTSLSHYRLFIERYVDEYIYKIENALSAGLHRGWFFRQLPREHSTKQQQDERGALKATGRLNIFSSGRVGLEPAISAHP